MDILLIHKQREKITLSNKQSRGKRAIKKKGLKQHERCREEKQEVWRAKLAKRKREVGLEKKSKTWSPVGGHSYRQKCIKSIMQIMNRCIVLIQLYTGASIHCAIAALCVWKSMCTLAWHLAVYFFLPVCLEMSGHWQLCVNGWVPAWIGAARGRAHKDHRGPQLSWAVKEVDVRKG